MTKQEYLNRLRDQLRYYEGNHQDIILDYDAIIDELTDEGLTMQDIIKRLGSPSVLADAIAEEFGLIYTQQTIKSTTMPLWARNVLIIAALVLIIPVIFSMVFAVVGSLVGVVVGILALLIGGIFATGGLWASSASLGYKLLLSGTGVLGLISALIITYFVIYWSTVLVRYLISLARNVKQGGL